MTSTASRRRTPVERERLLQRHGIKPEEFEKAALSWELLEEIEEQHRTRTPEYETVGAYISQRLQHVSSVHSLKMRVKDPEHLIAKIVRKKAEDATTQCGLDSYEGRITDLIGLRALHLFKHDWAPIHQFIDATWEIREMIAYIREGDPKPEIADARAQVKLHPFGYRSIHYLVESRPEKKTYVAELQVRTIFEEGWSEIDHRIRYPRHSDDENLAQFLAIFNRLAGSADEMGTFIKSLSNFVHEQAEKLADRETQLRQKEAELQKTVAALSITEAAKNDLNKQIEALRLSSERLIFSSGTLALPVSSPDNVLIRSPSTIRLGLYSEDRTCSSCGKPYTNSPGGITITTLCEECRSRTGLVFLKP